MVRIRDVLKTRRSRLVSLAFVACACVAAVAAAWVAGGPGIGLALLIVSATLAALAKVVLELVTGVDRASRSVDEVAQLARKWDRFQGAQARLNEKAARRLDSLESATAKQGETSERILDRVRKVESTAGDLSKTSERILDRVRKVESTAGDSSKMSERILDRVRSVEVLAGSQTRFNESILARTRNLELSHRMRPAPPGAERRQDLAREMIAAALSAYERSAYFIPFAERIPAIPDQEPASERYPLVSLIVTCYNEERFVGEALQSIRAQSYDNWECIVVDDSSSDASVSVAEEAINGDERFRLLVQPENQGVVDARNRGLAHAAGEFIIFFDADDLLMEHSLIDRVKTLVAVSDPDVAGVYCGIRIADEGTQLAELPSWDVWHPRTEFFDFVSAAGECPFGPSQAMLRTDVVRALGGFAPEVADAEDWELWLRMMRRGFVFLPTKLLTVAYRQKATSLAQTRAVRHVLMSNKLIASAHAPDDLAGSPVLASYPFPEPLGHYQQILTRARRAVQYGTTAFVRGDVDAFDHILAGLDAGSWPLLRRHILLEGKIIDGLRRAAGLDSTDLPALSNEIDHLVEAVTGAVRLAAT